PDHGDKDDGDAGVELPELPQDVQAGPVGQAQVQENDARANLGDALQPFGARAGDLDPVCGGGEHMGHLIREQVRVVIDQQQVGHGTRAPARWEDPGRHRSLYDPVTEQYVPCLPPTAGRTRTSPTSWPPCAPSSRGPRATPGRSSFSPSSATWRRPSGR